MSESGPRDLRGSESQNPTNKHPKPDIPTSRKAARSGSVHSSQYVVWRFSLDFLATILQNTGFP